MPAQNERAHVPDQMKELTSVMNSIKTQLNEIQNAKIIAEKRAYAGVRVYFGIAYKDLKDSMGPTIFQYDYENIVASHLERSALAATT